jgi:hypothetical protein
MGGIELARLMQDLPSPGGEILKAAALQGPQIAVEPVAIGACRSHHEGLPAQERDQTIERGVQPGSGMPDAAVALLLVVRIGREARAGPPRRLDGRKLSYRVRNGVPGMSRHERQRRQERQKEDQAQHESHPGPPDARRKSILPRWG